MIARSLRETYRKMLRDRRKEMVRKSVDAMKAFMSGEIRQLISGGQEEGDCSVVYQYEIVSCRQFDALRENIMKIDLALKRLADDKYGLCEECGEEIGVERLMVIPFAFLCKDCQETKEHETMRRRRLVS